MTWLPQRQNFHFSNSSFLINSIKAKSGKFVPVGTHDMSFKSIQNIHIMISFKYGPVY